MAKKYLNNKNECLHPEWSPHGNGQYRCKYCGKTTTMCAKKVFKLLRSIVDLIHGENSKFIIENYIVETNNQKEPRYAPVHEVIPRQITWTKFKSIKKKLKNSNNSVLICCLDEQCTNAELVIYEVTPSV